MTSIPILRVGSPVDPTQSQLGLPGKIQLYVGQLPSGFVLRRDDPVQIRGTNFDGIYSVSQINLAANGNIISLNCNFNPSYQLVNSANLIRASTQSVLSPCPGNVAVPITRISTDNLKRIVLYFNAPTNPQDITEVINRNVSINGTNFDGVYNVVDANLTSNVPGQSTLSLGCVYSSSFRIIQDATFRVTDATPSFCPVAPSPPPLPPGPPVPPTPPPRPPLPPPSPPSDKSNKSGKGKGKTTTSIVIIIVVVLIIIALYYAFRRQ